MKSDPEDGQVLEEIYGQRLLVKVTEIPTLRNTNGKDVNFGKQK